MKKAKTRKIKQYITQNTVEAPLSVGGFVSDVLRQVGIEKQQAQENAAGDLLEGQELSLSDIKAIREEQKAKEEAPRFLDIDPGLNYKSEILGRQNQERQSQELGRKVEEIIFELKRLAQTSKELQAQFKEVVVEQRIAKPGKYHMTFFSFLLSLVKTARQKIEDSGAWLQASRGKAEKKGYWSMFKKHGESFFLSNERVVATQTG